MEVTGLLGTTAGTSNHGRTLPMQVRGSKCFSCLPGTVWRRIALAIRSLYLELLPRKSLHNSHFESDRPRLLTQQVNHAVTRDTPS